VRGRRRNSPEPPPDKCLLEDALDAQYIAASLFLPFVIERLRIGRSDTTEALLSIELALADRAEQRRLRVVWDNSRAFAAPPGVQEHTITEWAALGIACALLHTYCDGVRISSVAQEGDRFDYWISDGVQEFGLEVSGTISGDVGTRHRAKVRQLRDNPFGVDGYVAIADFALRRAILSFHTVVLADEESG
jgi:hypothetical protein